MLPAHVQPWARCEAQRLQAVLGVFTDIDDTLTTEGQVPMGVVAALAALRQAGLPVIAITGRPLAWSAVLAEQLPVLAVVAENGALALLREQGEWVTEYVQDAATRATHAQRLRQVAVRVLREVPGAQLARDSAGRVTDIAVDHAEFARLPAAGVDAVVAVMQAEGMNATVSSIHVNGWFGEHDKPSGAAWSVQRLLGRDLDRERERWVYVGDSTNDQPMFERFALSVGVANLLDFADRLTRWPAFVTQHDRGRGFIEVAEALLAHRKP